MPHTTRIPSSYPHRRRGFHREAEAQTAERLLGASHPLVTLLYAYHATVDAALAVAGVQAAALVLWWAGVSFGRALFLTAGVVQLALCLRSATERIERRDLCQDLLITGRDHLAIPTLALERRRLCHGRYQMRLARTLDELARLGAARRRPCDRARPMHTHAVLAAAEPRLRELARSLRAGHANPRGVALLARLITSGTSPLYGDDVRELQDELGRARYLLGLPE